MGKKCWESTMHLPFNECPLLSIGMRAERWREDDACFVVVVVRAIVHHPSSFWAICSPWKQQNASPLSSPAVSILSSRLAPPRRHVCSMLQWFVSLQAAGVLRTNKRSQSTFKHLVRCTHNWSFCLLVTQNAHYLCRSYCCLGAVQKLHLCAGFPIKHEPLP